MFALGEVVREVGTKILNFDGDVQDTRHIRGHEESTIDRYAYEWMLGSLEDHFSVFREEEQFTGTYLFELHELQDIKEEGDVEGKKLYLIGDEIDGTTNTKRALVSAFDYNPLAAVSIALCEEVNIGSMIVGVVYDMHNGTVFSGIKAEESYMAFCDRRLLDPKDFEDKQGDTSTRILVVGYSNRERTKKGEIEQAILKADETKKDFRIYDGSRSTTMDVLSILRNQYDAYVDPRALWEGSGAMLYPFDVAGVLPVALGCGLEVTDIYGNTIDGYTGKKEPLTMVVARKGLNERIVNAVKPIIERG